MKILEMKKPLGYEMVSNFNHKESLVSQEKNNYSRKYMKTQE